MSTKKKAVVKKAVGSKEKEVHALTEEVLNVVVGEVNEVLALNPAIGLDLTIDEKQTELKDCFELMTENDCFTPGTVNVLCVLGCNVKFKVKSEEKKEEKEVVKKEVAKKEKTSTYKDLIKSLIDEKKYSRNEILEKVAKAYPDMRIATAGTMLSGAKNAKWKVFSKVVKEIKDGILTWV